MIERLCLLLGDCVAKSENVRAAGETSASIAKSYAVDISMSSRL